MVMCDNCQHEFEIKVKTKKEGDIETTYFNCPSCNAEYVTLITDAKLRKLIQRTQNLLVKAKKSGKQKDIDIYMLSVNEVKRYTKDNNLVVKGMLNNG